jgi:hypothetical protein
MAIVQVANRKIIAKMCDFRQNASCHFFCAAAIKNHHAAGAAAA